MRFLKKKGLEIEEPRFYFSFSFLISKSKNLWFWFFQKRCQSCIFENRSVKLRLSISISDNYPTLVYTPLRQEDHLSKHFTLCLNILMTETATLLCSLLWNGSPVVAVRWSKCKCAISSS